MGGFSSDRTVLEYAREIWHIRPVKVELQPYDGGVAAAAELSTHPAADGRGSPGAVVTMGAPPAQRRALPPNARHGQSQLDAGAASDGYERLSVAGRRSKRSAASGVTPRLL